MNLNEENSSIFYNVFGIISKKKYYILESELFKY